ncbi:MAG: alpha/beta fold hydrolase [Chloroflexota bacterium]
MLDLGLARNLATFALGGAASIAALGAISHRQITRSVRKPPESDPDEWNLPAPEQFDVFSRDGVRIRTWLFDGPHDRPTVIVCHGHTAQKRSTLGAAAFLRERYNVALLDHRGHGESEGDRTTIGRRERLDLLAVLDELEARGHGPFGVVGFSMGGAAATHAAAEDGRIQTLVLDSMYAILRDTVAKVARRRGYPPGLAQLSAWAGCGVTALLDGHELREADPVWVIPRVSPRPILVIQGTDDHLVDSSQAKSLVTAAGSNAQLWLVDGVGHCKALNEHYPTYRSRVMDFLAGTLPSR